MALYAMGDLHLSLGVAKPMDVFGGVWEGYLEKLNQGVSVIGPGDTTEPGKGRFCLDQPDSRAENHSEGEPRLLVDHRFQILPVLRGKRLSGSVCTPQQLLLL